MGTAPSKQDKNNAEDALEQIQNTAQEKKQVAVEDLLPTVPFFKHAQFPLDIVLHIARYLNDYCLCQMVQVNRNFLKLFSHNCVWKRQCHAAKLPEKPEMLESYKQYYQHCYLPITTSLDV